MKKILLFLLIAPFIGTAQSFWTEVAPFGDMTAHFPSQISIVDDEVVWVMGSPNSADSYRYSVSLDAGQTWTAGDINLGSPDVGVANIHAVSATKAYAIGFPNNPSAQGGVWVTQDAGATWTQQTNGIDANTFWNLIHFFDLNNGLVVGDPQDGHFVIYTTSNGGETWTAVPTANIPEAVIGEYGYTNIFEARNQTFWFGTNKGH